MTSETIPYPTFGLEGKIVLVTGSSRGLGRWIALALAHAGADVVVTYRQAVGEGKTVAGEIRDMGRRCLLTRLDLADLSSMEAMMSEISGEFGGLDILVNNAGVNRPKKALEVTPEDFDHVTSVNLKGVYFCSQAAAKMMIPRGGGKIINLSSAAAFLVRRNITISVYAMTKAGMVMLTKALSSEWADYKINVNAIAPGYFKTPLTQDRLEDPHFKNSVLETTPLNRVGEPQDIMGAVMFLASHASDFITGQTLCVDGGRTVL
jgi:NAD(P)-dependent dehydrogenase (short-subunit alcohol dehydrogenase family)